MPIPTQYEEIIQKLEKDIRQHIAFENQLRIHIENLTNKTEELDASIVKQREDFDHETASMKREKRRLDDLLTIRENELAQIRNSFNEVIGQKEVEKDEILKKMEKMDQKYQKQILKLKEDLVKAKPISSTTTSTGGQVTKSHTSGKRSTMMQDTMLLNHVQENGAALHQHQLSTQIPQAFFGSATIDLNQLMSRQQPQI